MRIVRARAVRGPTFKVALLLASFPGRNDALHPDRPERSGCSEADLLLLRSRSAAQKQTCRSEADLPLCRVAKCVEVLPAGVLDHGGRPAQEHEGIVPWRRQVKVGVRVRVRVWVWV